MASLYRRKALAEQRPGNGLGNCEKYSKTLPLVRPPLPRDGRWARLACRAVRAWTSPASIFRPSSETIICRNLISIDAVQLSPLDEDVSDDSVEDEEEDFLSSSLLRMEPP